MRIKTQVLATITTGFSLLDDFGDMYDGIEKITGVAPFTHQLPRMAAEVTGWVKLHIPDFPDREHAERYGVNKDTATDYVWALLQRWGPEVEVPPMMVVPRDPIAEAVEMFGKGNVAVAVIDG